MMFFLQPRIIPSKTGIIFILHTYGIILPCSWKHWHSHSHIVKGPLYTAWLIPFLLQWWTASSSGIFPDRLLEKACRTGNEPALGEDCPGTSLAKAGWPFPIPGTLKALMEQNPLHVCQSLLQAIARDHSSPLQLGEKRWHNQELYHL